MPAPAPPSFFEGPCSSRPKASALPLRTRAPRPDRRHGRRSWAGRAATTCDAGRTRATGFACRRWLPRLAGRMRAFAGAWRLGQDRQPRGGHRLCLVRIDCGRRPAQRRRHGGPGCPRQRTRSSPRRQPRIEHRPVFRRRQRSKHRDPAAHGCGRHHLAKRAHAASSSLAGGRSVRRQDPRARRDRRTRVPAGRSPPAFRLLRASRSTA